MAGRSGTNAVGVVTAGALTAEVVTLVPMVVITATAVCQRKPSGGHPVRVGNRVVGRCRDDRCAARWSELRCGQLY